eukprot:scaffold238_cov102-Skeletonema_menzelii.AAC.4
MLMRGSAMEATRAGIAKSNVGFVHAYLGLDMSMLSLFATAADAVEMNGGRRCLCENESFCRCYADTEEEEEEQDPKDVYVVVAFAVAG